MRREFILYLEDMLQSIERIDEYIVGLDFKHFKMNYMVVDAIIRNFEIIGEASKISQRIYKTNILKSLGRKCTG